MERNGDFLFDDEDDDDDENNVGKNKDYHNKDNHN